ncbi:MAG: helix-turn-helix transcriptional regulator [Planctomycetaceae bacterium]
MAGDDAMEPLERLLNLVTLLLETPTPLTFEEIRGKLDAYRGDNVESAKRKFERDKDVLREYGVPLVMVDTDVWAVEQGYRIPKEQYYLPEISFEPDEIAALFVAAQSGTEETAAGQGVRKLLYGADGGTLTGLAGGPLVAGSDAEGALVMAAADAADARRRVRFGYRTAHGERSERDVDAYGAVFRGGHWYLVGHDHERDEIRAFRLSRFASPLTVVGEGSAPPEGFHAAEHVQAGPWVASGDDRATVAFTPEAAVLAEGSLAGAVREPDEADGRVVLSIPIADDAVLAGLLLQYGPDARVLAPPSLREEVVRRLRERADA